MKFNILLALILSWNMLIFYLKLRRQAKVISFGRIKWKIDLFSKRRVCGNAISIKYETPSY